MQDIGEQYLNYHFDNTFPKEIESRHLLKIDWYDQDGIRAAIYMSKESPDIDDVLSESIVDLVLLCPPLNIKDFENQ